MSRRRRRTFLANLAQVRPQRWSQIKAAEGESQVARVSALRASERLTLRRPCFHPTYFAPFCASKENTDMAEQPHNGAPDSPEGSLKPNAGPKGRAHRRVCFDPMPCCSYSRLMSGKQVKSLVKELEDQTQATELPTSPSSPTSSSSAQNSLTARPSSQSLRSISSSSREATPDLSS